METRIKPRPGLGALCLAFSLTLAACGGGGGGDPTQLTNDGYQALNSGDHAAAVKSFEAALGGLEPGTPDFQRAKMGEIRALIHLDASRARDQFLDHAQAFDAKAYETVGSQLTSAKKFEEAIAVLDAGIKRYSESPKLQALIDKVKSEAEKSGDTGALDSLKGLGYL